LEGGASGVSRSGAVMSVVYQAVERRPDGTERVRFTCNDRRAVERACSDYERKIPLAADGLPHLNAPIYVIRKVQS